MNLLTTDEQYLLFAIGISFGIGLLLVLLIIRRKPESRRELLTKYLVYLGVVVVCSLLLISPLRLWLVLVLVIGGLVELIRTSHGHERVRPMVFGYGIYLLLAGGLVYLTLMLERDVFLVYASVVVFDGFSQLAGQLLGRRKLAQRISPAKTVEGLLGGAAAVVLVLLLLPGDRVALAGPRLVAAFWIAATALSGDLLASRWKRLAGVKDFGQLLPAHGGLLDRFDSFIGVCGFSGLVLWLFDLLAFAPSTMGSYF